MVAIDDATKARLRPVQELPRSVERGDKEKVNMQTVDATPPADFPALVIVMDREIARRQPAKAFYLRVQNEDGVENVDLEGAVTPLEARKLAREQGYEPTHWMEATDVRPTTF